MLANTTTRLFMRGHCQAVGPRLKVSARAVMAAPMPNAPQFSSMAYHQGLEVPQGNSNEHTQPSNVSSTPTGTSWGVDSILARIQDSHFQFGMEGDQENVISVGINDFEYELISCAPWR